MNPLTNNVRDLLRIKKKIKHKTRKLKRIEMRAQTRLVGMHKKRDGLLNNLRLLIDNELHPTKVTAKKNATSYVGRMLQTNSNWLLHWNQLITMQNVKLMELQKEEQECNERLLLLRNRLRILPNRNRILRRCFQNVNSKQNDTRMSRGSINQVKMQIDTWNVEVRRIRNVLKSAKRLKSNKTHSQNDYIGNFQDFWDYEVKGKKPLVRFKIKPVQGEASEPVNSKDHKQLYKGKQIVKRIKSKLRKQKQEQDNQVDEIDEAQKRRQKIAKERMLQLKGQFSGMSMQSKAHDTSTKKQKRGRKLNKKDYSDTSARTSQKMDDLSDTSLRHRIMGMNAERIRNSRKILSAAEQAEEDLENELNGIEPERLKFDDEVVEREIAAVEKGSIHRASTLEAQYQQQQEQQQQEQQQQNQHREKSKYQQLAEQVARGGKDGKRKRKLDKRIYATQLAKKSTAEFVEKDLVDALIQLYPGVDIPNANNRPYITELRRLISRPQSKWQKKLPSIIPRNVKLAGESLNDILATNIQEKYRVVQTLLSDVIKGPSAMDNLRDKRGIIAEVQKHYMWRILDGVYNDLKVIGLSSEDTLKILTELYHKYIDEIVTEAIKRGYKVISSSYSSEDMHEMYMHNNKSDSFDNFFESRKRAQASVHERLLREQMTRQSTRHSFLSVDEDVKLVSSLDSIVKTALSGMDQRYSTAHFEKIRKSHEKYFNSLPKSPLMFAIEEQRRKKAEIVRKKEIKERKAKIKLERKMRSENIARLYYAPRRTCRQRQVEEDCANFADCADCTQCVCKDNAQDRCIRCGIELPPQPANSRTDLFLSESLLSACANAAQMPHLNADICQEPQESPCPTMSCSNIHERTLEMIQLIKDLKRCQDEFKIWQAAVRSCSNSEACSEPCCCMQCCECSKT